MLATALPSLSLTVNDLWTVSVASMVVGHYVLLKTRGHYVNPYSRPFSFDTCVIHAIFVNNYLIWKAEL